MKGKKEPFWTAKNIWAVLRVCPGYRIAVDEFRVGVKKARDRHATDLLNYLDDVGNRGRFSEEKLRDLLWKQNYHSRPWTIFLAKYGDLLVAPLEDLPYYLDCGAMEHLLFLSAEQTVPFGRISVMDTKLWKKYAADIWQVVDSHHALILPNGKTCAPHQERQHRELVQWGREAGKSWKIGKTSIFDLKVDRDFYWWATAIYESKIHAGDSYRKIAIMAHQKMGNRRRALEEDFPRLKSHIEYNVKLVRQISRYFER